MAEDEEPKKRARRPTKLAKAPSAKAESAAEAAPQRSTLLARAEPKSKAAPAAPAVRDIGIDVPPPSGTCVDHHCPFHGSLRVRGQAIDGVVVSTAMERTVIVERERLHFIPKFERYEKRTRRIPAHAPPCLGLAVGSRVTVMECRPLSKTVSFVAIHNRGALA